MNSSHCIPTKRSPWYSFSCICAVLACASLSFSAFGQSEADSGEGTPAKSTKDVGVKGEYLRPYERLNTFTGELSLSFLDISIPGNGRIPLQVHRVYNAIEGEIQDGSAWPYTTYPAQHTKPGGRWRIMVAPEIEVRVSPQFLTSHTDYFWVRGQLPVHFGVTLDTVYSGICGNSSSYLGKRLNVAVDLVQADGAKQQMVRVNGHLRSSENWQLICTTQTEKGRLILRSPDGITYSMGKELHPRADGTAHWLATHVQDVDGNSLDIEYTDFQASSLGALTNWGVVFSLPKSITTSDGRAIDFEHEMISVPVEKPRPGGSKLWMTEPVVSAVKAYGNKWSYVYDAVPDDALFMELPPDSIPGYLQPYRRPMTSVVLPDGRHWEFGYATPWKGEADDANVGGLRLTKIREPGGGNVYYTWEYSEYWYRKGLEKELGYRPAGCSMPVILAPSPSSYWHMVMYSDGTWVFELDQAAYDAAVQAYNSEVARAQADYRYCLTMDNVNYTLAENLYRINAAERSLRLKSRRTDDNWTWSYTYSRSTTIDTSDVTAVSVRDGSGNRVQILNYDHVGFGTIAGSGWQNPARVASVPAATNQAWRVGLLTQYSVLPGETFSLLGGYSESYTWDKRIGGTESYWLRGPDWLVDSGNYFPVLKSKVIAVPGQYVRTVPIIGLKIYAMGSHRTDYDSYDEYGYPGLIVETGPNGKSRRRAITYFHKPSIGLFGLASSEILELVADGN